MPLICGATAVPVDKHPAVKIPGGTTSGIALVSFNSDAFESYGLSRNDNAPVCRDLRRWLHDCAEPFVERPVPRPKPPGANLAAPFRPALPGYNRCLLGGRRGNACWICLPALSMRRGPRGSRRFSNRTQRPSSRR